VVTGAGKGVARYFVPDAIEVIGEAGGGGMVFLGDAEWGEEAGPRPAEARGRRPKARGKRRLKAGGKGG